MHRFMEKLNIEEEIKEFQWKLDEFHKAFVVSYIIIVCPFNAVFTCGVMVGACCGQ